MLYGDTIQDTRQVFFSSWLKYTQNQVLLPLEQQLVDVMAAHPEYHAMLNAGGILHDKAYYPELGDSNPFLHMGLHLTIRDQLATDRPAGITALFKQLLNKVGDPQTVEHLMMEPLAECLWQAQRNHNLPDEASYMRACRQILKTVRAR